MFIIYAGDRQKDTGMESYKPMHPGNFPWPKSQVTSASQSPVLPLSIAIPTMEFIYSTRAKNHFEVTTGFATSII